MVSYLVAPPHPEEEQRLRELEQVRPSDGGEPRFQRITDLACWMLKIQKAAICIVERDYLIIHHATGMETGPMPRAASLCGHVVHQNAAMEVVDTHADPRFENNPMVTGDPHIRFYAGIPIRSPSGLPLGSLCVIDSKPKSLGMTERWALKHLADLAGEELIRSPVRDPSE